jgi:hypothetical protein
MIWADEIIAGGSPSFRRFLSKGGIRARLALGFPQTRVTSDLDPGIQRADHGYGGGGARRNRVRGSNSFVLKILTSKPLALKILQTIFANPAPVAAFRGWEGGVLLQNPRFSRNGLAKKRSSAPLAGIFSTTVLRYNEIKVL